MGFFASTKNETRYGVMIDIGSGSVLAAIIGSNPEKSSPDIIWSKREHSPLRQINSVSDSAKSVMTSLMNVLMILDGEGRKVFQEKTGQKKLPFLQVSIAAPWSYTATKTIAYEAKEAFEVTDTLVDELVRTADKKVEEEMIQNEKIHNLGLEIISKTTLQVMANGYPIAIGEKQMTNSIKVVESSAVAQEYLINAIDDARNKILTKSNLEQYSFMLPFYFVINNSVATTSDYCLVDITFEATEIGIVREGVLNYCTHTPYGSFSIARELSEVLGVPLEEAFGYLSVDDMSDFLAPFSEEKKAEVALVLKSYQDKLIALFKETGDSLSIPRKIYLHGNLNSEPFFNKNILAASKGATKMQHAVYNVTSELLTKHYKEEDQTSLKKGNQDTALIISALFFHNTGYHSKFTQL
jgi:hypothetical protein